MRGWGLVATVLLGCRGELVGGGATSEGTEGDGGSVGEATSPSVGSDGMSGSAASESGAAPSTSGDSGTTIDTCGDGTLDPDEECDDGNRVDGDACSSGCTATFDVVWTVSHDDGAGGTEHAYAVVVDTEGIYVLGDEDPLGAPVRSSRSETVRA
jgi:cysteine-rich repeat protein